MITNYNSKRLITYTVFAFTIRPRNTRKTLIIFHTDIFFVVIALFIIITCKENLTCGLKDDESYQQIYLNIIYKRT